MTFIEHPHGIHVAVTAHATARVRESDAIDPTDRHRWYWRVDGIESGGVAFGWDAGYAATRKQACEDAAASMEACR